MDLRLFIGGLIICLYSFVSVSCASYNCRMCKPGYYASHMCSSNHDTVCKPCPKGRYSDIHNILPQCQPCSTCPPRHFVQQECSRSTDTVCTLCESGRHKPSAHFYIACLQSDDPHITLAKSAGVTLTESKHDSVDIYESSSEPEGSGVLETVVDTKVYPILKGTEEEEDEILHEMEGSGVTDTGSDIINITTTVIITDEDKDTQATASETTTVRVGLIIPEGGTVLDNTTEIELESPIEDSPSEVKVYIEDTNEPKTGASQTQNGNADNNGASVGIVVTVGLVTAFVFFVLGFLASRVWNGRRERTFNVLEAERRNGKRPVECSGIEYKDPENNISKPGLKNGTEPKPFRNSDQGPPIYKKPIQKSSAAPTNTQPPRASKPDPSTERPASEIKFMDEGSDHENETDKLLPSDPAPDSKSTPPNGVQTTPPANIADQDTTTENTPMLPKDDTQS